MIAFYVDQILADKFYFRNIPKIRQDYHLELFTWLQKSLYKLYKRFYQNQSVFAKINCLIRSWDVCIDKVFRANAYSDNVEKTMINLKFDLFEFLYQGLVIEKEKLNLSNAIIILKTMRVRYFSSCIRHLNYL